MEETTHQLSSEKTSLLILIDDCLNHIFKFLELKDCINLAKTCSRLLCVVQQCKKFKMFEVVELDLESEYDFRRSDTSKEEFFNILSVIGEQVVSVHLTYRNFYFLKTIAESCTNLSSICLYNVITEKCRKLQLFHYLKTLQIGPYNLSTDEWKKCFANNPGIENFELYDNGCNTIIPLLKMLPKLKSLKINCFKPNPEEFHHLSCLTSLTTTDYSCNRLLTELAKKLNLVELDSKMPHDADTFDILQSFLHLQVLSMRLFDLQTVIFPSMLKRIKFNGFLRISCSFFLSIVKQLMLLEEFDITGSIFCDNDESECFPTYPPQPGYIYGSTIIFQIAKQLRAENRKLKIMFGGDHLEHEVCKYSDQLEIIINPRHFGRLFDHTLTVNYNS